LLKSKFNIASPSLVAQQLLHNLSQDQSSNRGAAPAVGAMSAAEATAGAQRLLRAALPPVEAMPRSN